MLTFGGRKDAGAALKQESGGTRSFGKKGLGLGEAGFQVGCWVGPPKGLQVQRLGSHVTGDVGGKGHQLLSAKLDFGS